MCGSWLLSGCSTWLFLVVATSNQVPWSPGGRSPTKHSFRFKPWVVTCSHSHAGFSAWGPLGSLSQALVWAQHLQKLHTPKGTCWEPWTTWETFLSMLFHLCSNLASRSRWIPTAPSLDFDNLIFPVWGLENQTWYNPCNLYFTYFSIFSICKDKAQSLPGDPYLIICQGI